MKIHLGILFTFFSCLAFSQLTIRPIAKSQHAENRTHKKTVSARINKNTLPFWDDFSITPDGMPDSIRIWDSDSTRQWNLDSTRGVFVNSTLAINPPSYKVITFDGLDDNGLSYGEEQGLTDRLVSDTLDLSAYNEADDIFLSFYWQAGGNVEPPNEGDSLRLAFYSQLEDRWISIWSIDGVEVETDSLFYQETIKLEQRFISDVFMFSFSAYGDQDGPFDAWHLDWIYINVDRSDDDFFYQDVSINTDPSVLFSPFRSIPTNQIEIASFSANISVTAMNLNEEEVDMVGPDLNYSIELIDTETLEVISASTARVNDISTFLNVDPFIVDGEGIINYGDLSFNNLTLRDSIVIQSEIILDTTNIRFLDSSPINLRVNDTVRTQYLLQNFYAYDDGTAEYSAGTNVIGGQVGVQYWVQNPDTLTHVDIHFPDIAPSNNQSALTIRILNNLSDLNPLRTQIITVNIADTINQFERYEFERPVIVSDTFYVVYEQNINEYIGIGFDRSNSEASQYIFENIEGQWIRNDLLQGALMIRPVFQSGSELTLSEKDHSIDLNVYPNPTTGHIKVTGEYQRIEVRNILGQILIIQERRTLHELTTLDPGLYLVSVVTKSGVVTKKILKQ